MKITKKYKKNGTKISKKCIDRFHPDTVPRNANAWLDGRELVKVKWRSWDLP
jgi:hypothetical protein